MEGKPRVRYFSRPRPVLMIPLRRCGSRGLSLRLGFNREFCSPYPLHIAEFMPLVPLYGDLADDEAYFQAIVDLIGLQNANRVRWESIAADPLAIFDRLKDEPRSVLRIVWELLFEVGRAQRAGVVMDGSLDCVQYAEELIELFEDFRFLNVVRDPRDQVASMNRAMVYDYDSLLNALTWVRAHDAARRLTEKYPERVYTIRYEDMLSDQETALRGVCDFLGLEFLPEMLDVPRTIACAPAASTRGPVAVDLARLQRELGAGEMALIETLAAEHMDHYGYPRTIDEPVLISDEDIRQAQSRSDERKHAAWEALRFRNRHDYQLRRFRADYIDMVWGRLIRERPGLEARQSGGAYAERAGHAASRDGGSRPAVLS